MPDSNDSNGWRRIADEMPPEGRTVLLWALTDPDTGNWKMETGHYSTSNRIWYWQGWMDRPYHTKPTHWQPLPAPPRAEDGR